MPGIAQALAIGRLIRELGAQSLSRTQIIARHLDLNVTDLRAFELLYLGGPLTAGELGTGLALTSGSVTAMINRLLVLGYVQRRVDDEDRRKVWISVRTENIQPIMAPFWSTIAATEKVFARFSTKELETIGRFMGEYREASISATRQVAVELQTKK